MFRLDTPSIVRARASRQKAQLHGLCDAFEGRLEGLEFVRHLADYNERVIAFETLCDRFFSADSAPELSLAEFEQLAALGEALGCRSEWVHLIDYLKPEERERIPAGLRTLAKKQLALAPG